MWVFVREASHTTVQKNVIPFSLLAVRYAEPKVDPRTVI